MNKKILLVTANSFETNAILNAKDFFSVNKRESSKKINDSSIYNIGRIEKYTVIHFELQNQGVVKADASNLAINDAIDAWKPDAVIMVGICFGKDEENSTENCQHIGDVLISNMVADYESGKIKDGALQSDGAIAECGPHLFSIFRNYSNTWKHNINGRRAKVFFGTMLSGDKVIDDKGFKEFIFKRYERAIGGEMEGRGLYAACRRNNLSEWIMIKAICDWGTSKDVNKDTNQKDAAKSAVSLLKHVFNTPGAFDSLPKKNYTNECVEESPKPEPEHGQLKDGNNSINPKNIKGKNVIIGNHLTMGNFSG